MSVSRATDAVAIAAWGHPEPATLRLGRARGENQPGPRAGAPNLGCLRASLRRLGRFELLHTHLGDFSGCAAWAAEDSGPDPRPENELGRRMLLGWTWVGFRINGAST